MLFPFGAPFLSLLIINIFDDAKIIKRTNDLRLCSNRHLEGHFFIIGSIKVSCRSAYGTILIIMVKDAKFVTYFHLMRQTIIVEQ